MNTKYKVYVRTQPGVRGQKSKFITKSEKRGKNQEVETKKAD